MRRHLVCEEAHVVGGGTWCVRRHLVCEEALGV